MPTIAKVNIHNLLNKYYIYENKVNFTKTLEAWRRLPNPWIKTAIYSHHIIYLIAISRKDLKNT